MQDEPHLLFEHEGRIESLDISDDGRWIVSGGQDGTVRVWPMPDLSKQPFHTLSHDRLLAKLRSLTNVRVVEDLKSPDGYRLAIDRFPGWERTPEW